MGEQTEQEAPLAGLVVIEMSEGIAGGYCGKWLVDAGAEVVKLEPEGGDPLRRWAIGTTVEDDDDGALFKFLAGRKRSVVVDPAVSKDIELTHSLLRAADIVIWSDGRLGRTPGLAADDAHELAPAAAVVAITHFGLTGPWKDRPATELTLQAWSGGVAGRGAPDRPPVQAGGRPVQWLAGITGAVAALTAYHRVCRSGQGELVDVSMLETATLMLQMYPVIRKTMLPSPTPEQLVAATAAPGRSIMIPSIERAKDGWVGFMCATSTQWEMFSLLVGHPEWPEDTSTYGYVGRAARRAELQAAIDEWVGSRTVAEVIEDAVALRVPVAPIGTGATLTGFDHFAEGGFFVPSADGRFVQPDVPYTLHGSVARRPPGRAPRLGEHTEAEWALPRLARATRPLGGTPTSLPFEGLRVADFTAFWAGPIIGHYLAMLGADVIHVESSGHPDGIRAHTIKTVDDDQWWEYSPLFFGPNTNKRDVTIDMSSERGRALALRLIAECDVLVENYSPRVMEHWGLDDATVRAVRPDIIFLRCPAFGLSGPWRDRTGYAQSMEQASGMAWMTGFPDGPPHVPNGVCDPLAGTHATAALLLALEHRRRTGEGMQVEVAMIGGALNVAAEQVIESSAYGHVMERQGNRGMGAPQNLYLANDVSPGGLCDTWVAIDVQDDEHWDSLRRALGKPGWATDAALDDAPGRRAAHDVLDKHLAEWCHERSADEIVATLWPAGVPVGKAVAGPDADGVEQHVARQFFEPVVHPLAGEYLHPGYPARFTAGPLRLHRSSSPTLGEHNREVFGQLLGLGEDELASLEAEGVIGTRLRGVYRTR